MQSAYDPDEGFIPIIIQDACFYQSKKHIYCVTLNPNSPLLVNHKLTMGIKVIKLVEENKHGK